MVPSSLSVYTDHGHRLFNIQKIYPSHVLPFPQALYDYTKQSVEISETRKPGGTGIYRNAWSGALYDFRHKPIRQNAVELFESGLQVSANKPCLGCRPITSQAPLIHALYYKWQTYAEVDVRRRSLGSALEFISQETMGIGEAVLNIGIWGCSSPGLEWQVADLACQAYGKITTILDESWDSDMIVGMTLIFITLNHLPTLLKLSAALKYLRGIIIMENISPETYPIAKGWTNECNLRFFTIFELEKLGRDHIRPPIMPTDAQICTICYTSGATGPAKAAILTHGQIALAVSASEWGLTYKEAGVTLSSLPLSSVHQRLNDLSMLNRGGAIGYSRGNMLDLLEDMQILKPSIWTTVSPVLNRLYQTLSSKIPGLKEKLTPFHSSKNPTPSIWDRMAFTNAKQSLGGNLQAVILAGSPANPETTQSMRMILSCPIYEGYVFGMTETFGPILRTLPHDPNGAGSVGIPLPHMEVKLVDVPQLNLTWQDKPRPRGELCCRSVGLFLGYYQDSLNTDLTLDREGWIHTGDIAEVDIDGRFRILGRKTNIVKFSGGDHVALEQIEGIYSAAPNIRQVFVHGDTSKGYLVALVIPTVDYLCQLGAKFGGENVSPLDRHILNMVVRDKRVKALIQDELHKHANNLGLHDHERIYNIHIMLDMFYSDGGDDEMASLSAMKVNRHVIYSMYQDILNGL
ncbi:hypothetical protein Clacol_005884 [Clathrus columnatus]|uniref:AMP-dependent synthetase/ligase domain-containing protein n=1 Tax=Clathrus columnatus TaxID=1419009 RepID=A0AAV5AET6_9AGAM|nr:hypothetical protein Clacol_005884 [Clathrus columnatus]